MISKTGILGLPILLGFLLVSTSFAFASHGHDEGGGGGCNGDCTPPTLGIDNAGAQHVHGGFSVNGVSFDVLQWENIVEKQVVKTGETVEITLKVFENGGTQNLSHVGLMLGVEEKMINGIIIQDHFAQINWNQSFDGIETVEVVNPYNVITNVDVESESVDNLVVLTFRFTPIESFDANTIVVNMWDYRKASWTNYFQNALEIETAEFITTLSTIVVDDAETHDAETHDAETHDAETHDAIPDLSEFTCEDNSEVVLRAADYSPVCVSAYEKSILIAYGWAISIE